MNDQADEQRGAAIPAALPPPGPKVVALGGGHGLAVTLTAARRYASAVTAVVSTADDGGSTGRLRRDTALPAMGDIRRCLTALAADPTDPWTRAIQHRFVGGDLDGHPAGNVVLAALALELGDFAAAVDLVGELMGTVGRVLPATVADVVLVGRTANGPVRGQSAVQRSDGLRGVVLDPPQPPANPAALAALAEADQIVVGPGSLYTSVLAVLAVPDITAAVVAAPAPVVYVANLDADEAECSGYDTRQFIDALVRHGVVPDVVVVDDGVEVDLEGLPSSLTVHAAALRSPAGRADGPAGPSPQPAPAETGSEGLDSDGLDSDAHRAARLGAGEPTNRSTDGEGPRARSDHDPARLAAALAEVHRNTPRPSA